MLLHKMPFTLTVIFNSSAHSHCAVRYLNDIQTHPMWYIRYKYKRKIANLYARTINSYVVRLASKHYSNFFNIISIQKKKKPWNVVN